MRCLARLPGPLLLVTGGIALLATCFLPSEPKTPRILFILPKDTVIAVAAQRKLAIGVTGDSVPLSQARVRLESRDTSIATTDTAGNVVARRRGVVAIRVVLVSGAIGTTAPETTFAVRVIVSRLVLARSVDSLFSFGDTLLFRPGYRDANDAPLPAADSAAVRPQFALASLPGRAVTLDPATGAIAAKAAGTDTVHATVDTAHIDLVVTVRQRADSVAIMPKPYQFRSLTETRQFSAAAWDRGRNPIAQPAVSWQSRDATIVSVTGAGLATAVKNGTTTLKATVDQVSDSTAATVAQVARRLRGRSGNGQSATAATPLPAPFVIQLTDSLGVDVAAAGVDVAFRALSGGGKLNGQDSTAAASDGAGQASATLTLGTSTAVPDSLRATSSGFKDSVVFTATPLPGPATALGLVGGNGQSDTIGGTLPNPIVVKVTDTYGNPVPSFAVRFAVTGGGGSLSDTLKPTDAAGFVGSRWNVGPAPGSNTALAFVSGLSGSPVSFTATATSAPASTTTSAVTVSRSVIQSGETATLRLQAKDASGNNETTGGLTVVFTASGGTSAGTISGTTDNGDGTYTATFTGTTAGTATTIGATIGGKPVTSALPSLTVTPGPAAKLAFTAQPSNATAGDPIAPAIQVAVQDLAGNTVSGATNAITLAIGSNPGTATLFGTVTKSAANGSASFSDLKLDKVGTDYTFAATASGLVGATSGKFNITPAAAAKLAFAVQPSNANAGQALTPAVQVAIQDAFGNTVTGATNTVTMALSSNPGGATLSGVVTMNPTNGVASFSDLSLNKPGSSYRLTASATLLSGATSVTFDISAGAPAQLAFRVQPSNAVAGVSIAPAVQVTILDALGNTVTGATNAVTLAIGTNPGGGTLFGTTTVAAASGVATFSNLSLNKAGSYTLSASAAGLTGATSGTFGIAAASAAKLALSVQPSNDTAGVVISPAVKVSVQDAFGNTVTNASNPVTVAITSGTGTAGASLFGTTTVSAASGVATFSNLSLDKAGTGYTLSASATGLSGATSSAFNVLSAAPSHLVLTFQPSNATAGAAITPAVQVALQDAAGNTVASATNPVTLAIGTNPGGATLSGTTTVNAISGVATFSDLSLNKVGTGYTLSASSSGLAGATSGSFNITPAAASKLAFTVQPNGATAGQLITPAAQVSIEDQFGNTVASAMNAVTLAIGNNPVGGTLSGTVSKPAVSGVASFSDLSIDKGGTGYTLTAAASGLTGAASVAFTITATVAVSATNSSASANPATGVVANGTATSTVTVTARDASNNPVAGQTVRLNATGTGNSITQPAGTTDASGVATGAIASTMAEPKTITVTVNPGAAQTVLTTQPTVQFVAPVATKLFFTVQPSNATAGASIAPAVQVTIQDASGNTVTSATNAVTLTIASGPVGATLFGTTTAAAASGVASFSTLSINKASSYTLSATATGLTGATSSSFAISPATAAKLAFSVQPSNATASAAIAPAIQVSIQDTAGNTVTSATNAVTVAIGTNPGGGTLFGTTTAAAVSGVATFSNLSIDKAGSGYTLTATSGSLTGATSSTFTINSGTASQLAFTVQPSNVVAGAAITPAVQVAIQDASGNTVTSSIAAVTIAIGSNPGGATLSGTKIVSAVNGVATFTDLTLNRPGTGYTLTASSGTLSGATSAAFNVTPGAPAALAFTVQPSSATAGVAIAPAIQVTILDALGNTVTTATNPVTLGLGANPSGGTLFGTVTKSAVGGVATFSDLSINKVGTGYTLAAAATGLTGATSTGFNITPAAASQLAFTVQPSNATAGVAITPAVQVSLRDQFGNLASGATNPVTVAIGTNPSTGTLLGTKTVSAVNGVATFSDLSIDKAGTAYTLTASSPLLTGATSGAFNVAAAGSSKLVFAVQPVNATAGQAISPTVQVAIQDAFGNTVPGATDAVTIAIGTNAGGGTLSGTLMQSALNGVASFSDLSINKVGTGYTLGASSGSLAGATSGAFNITAGAPAKLALTAQPTTAAAGAAINPAVQVSVLDGFGNTVTSATNAVTVALGSNPGSGTLSGTLTKSPTNGLATFSDLSINKTGTGYALTAAATGLTGATSTGFNITPAPAAALVFTVQPSNATAGVNIAPAVQLTVQDAFANTVDTSTAAVTLAIGTNPGSDTVSGTKTVNAVSGVATFAAVRIRKAGNGYTLVARSGSITSVPSNAFNITPGPVNSATVSPATVTLATLPTPGTAQLSAAALDSIGNVVPGQTFSWNSDNSLVAIVDQTGKVTAVGPGTAHITATTAGKSGVATVTVTLTTGAHFPRGRGRMPQLRTFAYFSPERVTRAPSRVANTRSL